jgi:SAM-dependent methyltransferase
MDNTNTTKSYADFGLARSWRQLVHAFGDRRHAEENMGLLYEMLQTHEARIAAKLGRPVEGLRILEIGPGQGMERGRYFGLKNEVTGIDLDVIPQGFEPGSYWRMLRKNGAGRFAKTIGRKLILAPANAAAWEKTVGQGKMRPPQVVHGDICGTPPDFGQFDLIMSWSVFEHLPEPQTALDNVVNLLRPGGVFYLSLHLYTSHNGHHDIRAFTGQEETLPLWGHLRPSTCHLINPSSYLNEWRLDKWRALFQSIDPAPDEFLERYDSAENFASQLTAEEMADLEGYTEEELQTVDVIYLWKKPVS